MREIFCDTFLVAETMADMVSDCRVCGKPTNVIFNIELKKVSVCESCANSIAWQQMESLLRERNARLSYEELTTGITEEFLIAHDKRESNR
jgi:hypothetical protein